MRVTCNCKSCDTEMDASEAFEKDGLYYCDETCVSEQHPVKKPGCGQTNCCHG